MVKLYGKKSKTYKKPRTLKQIANSAKPSKAFVKKVKKIMHKDVESKESAYTLTNTDFNGPVNNVADACRVIPSLTQGYGNGQRIADSVLLQRIDLRGHMMINIIPNTTGTSIPTAIPSTCRIMVRAFIFSIKRFANYDDAVATTSYMSKFLKNGLFTQGLDGTVKSMYLPVNTDVITVHKEFRKYISVPAIFAQTATATGFSNTAVGFENSCKFFNFRKSYKKTLKYDDAGFAPQNFAPLFCLSYAKLDDTSPDLLVARVTASYVSSILYEDA